MNEGDAEFIGYEYREIIVQQEMEAIYLAGYANFGWVWQTSIPSQRGVNMLTLTFKRERHIRNKTELTRLQRQFDACAHEIVKMEKSKETSGMILALTVGLVGTGCIAGMMFAFKAGHMVVAIMLTILGFIGWGLPYFLFRQIVAQKSRRVTPLIEAKYAEVYTVCQRGNRLLGF